jgi:hypothetical protein
LLKREFSPADHIVEMEDADGDVVTEEFADLKAVFFIKDPRRRDLEVHISAIESLKPATSGAAARVEFFDGEVIHGRVSQYSVDEHGFFLFPVAAESNNERVFVVVQALKTLYVETARDGGA